MSNSDPNSKFNSKFKVGDMVAFYTSKGIRAGTITGFTYTGETRYAISSNGFKHTRELDDVCDIEVYEEWLEHKAKKALTI